MFENLKGKRLFERIVDQVKEAVLSGKLKVGDKLPPEHELAREFGVSRNAVREALRILELSGLVNIRKGSHGGCFIQKLSSNKKLIDYLTDNWSLGQITLSHLTEARYWLEAMVMDIIADKITDKDIDRLRKSIDKVERLYNEGNDKEKVDENLNFHILLVRLTGNTILVDTLSAILELLSYMMREVKPGKRIMSNSCQAHRQILDLLEAGEIERAKAVNNAHLRDVSAPLMKLATERKGPPNLQAAGPLLL
jgi:DNA-binding FadR family transcriptional regulator